MRPVLATLCLLLSSLALPAGEKKPAGEKEEGFVSLFNGADFTGWRFDERGAFRDKWPANWSVAGGVIKLSGGGSPHLASQWDYEDFELRLEWKAGTPK